MELNYSKADNYYLDYIRYKTGYHPFTRNYKPSLNKVLLQNAQQAGVGEAALNLISSGDYFYHLQQKLFQELTAIYRQLHLAPKIMAEFFVALLNEQEWLNDSDRQGYIGAVNMLSAVNIQLAEIRREGMADNPQNFSDVSEAIVDFANLFLEFLFFQKQDNTTAPKQIFDEQTVALGLELVRTVNKFHSLKTHYEACLAYNGNITIDEKEGIFFDTSSGHLEVVTGLKKMIMQNEWLNRYHYFKLHSVYSHMAQKIASESASHLIISQVAIANGYVKFSLRRRVLADYMVYANYMILLVDFYPFYEQERLAGLCDMTVNSLLRFQAELSNLADHIYTAFSKRPETRTANKFIGTYLPKIKHSVLKGYLKRVTKATDLQVETFLQMVSTDLSSTVNLYATHLIKSETNYFFPFYSITHPNYLFLIDHWLEKAGEPMHKRGTAFENYLKGRLFSLPQGEANKFKVISRSKFEISEDKYEQIDLIIATKYLLIMAEVKCIKYPMHARDYYDIYSKNIVAAAEQLNRKAAFLLNHADSFKDDVDLSGRRIVKVVVLNLPVFVGTSVESIPIIDGNFFISYFKTGKMVWRTFDDQEMSEVATKFYYTNEEEFSNNFETYLTTHPMVEEFRKQVKTIKASYQLPGLPPISFTTTTKNE